MQDRKSVIDPCQSTNPSATISTHTERIMRKGKQSKTTRERTAMANKIAFALLFGPILSNTESPRSFNRDIGRLI